MATKTSTTKRSRAGKTSAAASGKGGAAQPSPVVWLGLSNQRTLLLFALLFVMLASGLSVVRTTHQNRFAFNALQELKEEAVDLNVQWGQLLIEQSTFGLDSRIEEKAASELGMQIPDLADVVMVRHD